MHYLSRSQIEKVIAEIEKAEITYSHLKDDLIDHLCCEIENKINNGQDFTNAFEEISNNIGVKELKKVQENTLILIDKKYKFMKTSLKISGLASMAMIVFGALFKISHWPGAAILLLLGFAIIGFVFLPTSLWVLRKESKLQHPSMLYILGFIGGFVLMAGYLFKIMHWPSANLLVLGGYMLFCILFMPLLLYALLKSTNKKKYKTAYIIGVCAFLIYLLGNLFKIMHWPGAAILILSGTIFFVSLFVPYFSYIKYKESISLEGSFIFFIVGTLFFILFGNLMIMNTSKNIINQFIEPISAISAINKNIDTNNNIEIQDYLSKNQNDTINKSIQQIHNAANELSNYIHDLKIEIITSIDLVNKTQAENIFKEPGLFFGKENSDRTTSIMLGKSHNIEQTSKASLIKVKLNAFTKTVNACFPKNKFYQTLTEDLFSTQDKNNQNVNKHVINWENHLFNNNIAISTLLILTQLELNIKLVEAIAIQEIQSKKNK